MKSESKMKATTEPLIPQGWIRVLIYLVAIVLIQIVVGFVAVQVGSHAVSGVERSDESLTSFALLSLVMDGASILCTWFFVRFFDRRSFGSLGFRWKDYVPESILGCCTAMSILGLGSLILVLLKYIVFTGVAFHAAPLLSGVILMIATAFGEEIIVRGYVLGNLIESMNKWLALGISSLLFALLHLGNPDVSVLALVNVFAGGMILGINYIYTRNLWFGIVLHFVWNFFQGSILGFEVSGTPLTGLFQQTTLGPSLWTGGAFGFEGSLLCFVLIAITVFILSTLFQKRYETDAQ